MRPPAYVPAIVWRIVLLVALSVTAATIANLAITFSGPPPMPAPWRVADLAAVLSSGDPEDGPGRSLSVTQDTAPPTPRPGEQRHAGIEAALSDQIGLPVDQIRAYFRPVGPGQPPHGGVGGGPAELRGEFTMGARSETGWTIVQTVNGSTQRRWQVTVLGTMVTVLILLTLVAWWVARAITRPLTQLADAADTVTAGNRGPPVPVSGPPEIVRVASALNAMRERLLDHVAARTTMLAAITHDLGTPLTRLAFRIERMPAADRDRAAADIEEMRAMIMSVLEFARGETRAHERLDLAPLIRSLVDDMAGAGAAVSLTGGSPLPVLGDAASLRRLFSNLMENALRYGHAARVSASRSDGRVLVTIDDEGPGIAPALAERLFEPFFRGEPSRSRDTGGIGLGLAIARNIAEAHKGTITAGNRPEGGARFTVSLPLADDLV